MVNNATSPAPPRALTLVVGAYVVNVVMALVVLVVLALVDPPDATPDAWVHSLVVAALAVVLLRRLQAARAGRRSGLRAVGIICSLLLLANVLLVLAPGLLPGWLRVDAALVAALMVTAVVVVVATALDDA